MKYYCPKCRSTDHWANEVCPKNKLAQAGIGTCAPPSNEGPRSGLAPAIKQDSTRKVGRPRIYPDRKTQMRELMRRKRDRIRQSTVKGTTWQK